MLWRRRLMGDSNFPYDFSITTLNHSVPHPPTQDVGYHLRTLHIHLRGLTDHQLLDIMTLVGPQLEELRIRFGQQITDPSFQHVPRHYPNLTRLDLTQSSITMDCIPQLGLHCHRLTHLHFVDCPHLDASLFATLAHCPLTDLHLSNSTMFDHVATSRTQLHVMSTHKQQKDPARSVFQVLTSTRVCPTALTHVTIEGSCDLLPEHATILPFLQTHPHLTYVYMTHAALTDASLEILSTMMAVATVTVSFNPQLTPRGIRRLVWRCRTHLTELSFDNCGMTPLEDFPDLVEAAAESDRPPPRRGFLAGTLLGRRRKKDAMMDPQRYFTHLGQVKFQIMRQHSNETGDYLP
ncbi:unnamed protein product [Absidia cylindrospora]